MGDEPSRRSMLKSIGAGAGVVATANVPDWGEMTDLGPDDWEPGAPAFANVQTPDTITYTKGGEDYTIHLEPARVESCQDYINWADTQPESSDDLPTPGLTTLKPASRLNDYDMVEINRNAVTSAGDPFPTATRVSINDASVRTNRRIKILDWRPDYELTEACRASYCDMLRRAIEHEINHYVDYERLAREFEDWVANNRPEFVVRPTDEEAAYEAANTRLANMMVEFSDGNRRLPDGSLMPGSVPWTHDRVGATVNWDCDACAHCREVNGNNWTYRDIPSWTLRVGTTLQTEFGSLEDAGEVIRVRTRYAGTFELERVPPSTVRKAIGGVNAVTETVQRFRAAGSALGSGSVSDRMFGAIDALKGGNDVISDGQPPMIWMGKGRVTGRVNAARLERTSLRCVQEEREEVITTEASGTVTPSDMTQRAYLVVVPRDNTVKFFWPDVKVPGTVIERHLRCEDGEPRERVLTRNQAVLDYLTDEESSGFFVYGGAAGLMSYQVDQIQNGAKSPGGHSADALAGVAGNPSGFYDPRALSTEEEVGSLVGDDVQKLLQERIVTRPNPFFTVEECQRSGFETGFERRTLVGSHKYPSGNRYSAMQEPFAPDDAEVGPGGHESVDIRLRATLPSDEDHRPVDCGGIR